MRTVCSTCYEVVKECGGCKKELKSGDEIYCDVDAWKHSCGGCEKRTSNAKIIILD